MLYRNVHKCCAQTLNLFNIKIGQAKLGILSLGANRKMGMADSKFGLPNLKKIPSLGTTYVSILHDPANYLIINPAIIGGLRVPKMTAVLNGTSFNSDSRPSTAARKKRETAGIS